MFKQIQDPQTCTSLWDSENVTELEKMFSDYLVEVLDKFKYLIRTSNEGLEYIIREEQKFKEIMAEDYDKNNLFQVKIRLARMKNIFDELDEEMPNITGPDIFVEPFEDQICQQCQCDDHRVCGILLSKLKV